MMNDEQILRIAAQHDIDEYLAEAITIEFARALLSASIADTANAHAIGCEYIQSDNPWARCTCGVGGPNDGRESIADTDVIETPDGQNIMQVWFECGRDVFAFYDRIMGMRESITDTAGAKSVGEIAASTGAMGGGVLVWLTKVDELPIGTRFYAAPPAPSVADAAGASDKPLTDAQIEAGWRQTFSTDNPYCPCNLKSFTKAVRWAERAKETK